MKRLLLTAALGLCLALCTQAQSVTAAEYFIDADPGAGNGTAITVTSGSTVTFSTSIPISALANGFHVAAIRVKDASGQWGLYESRGFYISTSTTDVTSIVAAEYYIDADPGVGNGIAITPVSAGTTVSFTTSMPVASLTAGFHFIAIRTKDASGQWGLYESRGFYISTSTTNVTSIVAAEYFIDADPGVGNGIAITPVSAGNTVNFATSISAVSLAPGFHFLAIRTKDASGQWGLYESRGFYISTSTTNVSNITAAEYFIDTDPGVGNGIAVTPVTSGSTVNLSASLPVTALAPGFHFLAIRTKDASGQWGLYESRGFYISTQSANMPDITAAEYFLDTDPGVGNATAITVPAGQSFNQTFSLLIPPGTPDGQHFIAIRVKDANGVWGLFDFDTLTVAGSIPVTGLNITARKEQNRVAVNWHTLTEINTSHFELERSIDGSRFEKIYRAAAAGNSNDRRDYAYTDLQPFVNLNYYRIKQVDRDGHFIYSAIRLVRMNDEKPFLVYPTVTNGNVTISGITNPVQISVYNAAKQPVKTVSASAPSAMLDLHTLPAGTYWLLIQQAGKLVHQQAIIKQ